MSKRNKIAYIKPHEPSFIKKLKQEANYKEGPSVDTKRSELPAFEDDESYDDDNPTVVVLKDGDLTSDEALKEKSAKEHVHQAMLPLHCLPLKQVSLKVATFHQTYITSLQWTFQKPPTLLASFADDTAILSKENSKPADLSKRIIFKRPAKSTPQSEEKHRVNKKTKRSEKLVLSFDDEEEFS